MQNPFNITKAVDYTDDDIIKYWVDLSGSGFEHLIKPTSLMPMLVLGSKGSGKTHLMRFYSYQLQKIRHKENVFQGVVSDGYLGVYFRCHGLNADRFRGKGLNQEVWNSVFAYNLELWVGQLLLDIISEFDLSIELQKEVCAQIILLLEKETGISSTNFVDLKMELKKLQDKVDYAVNNSAIKRNLGDLEILLSPGKFIIGIPKILQKLVAGLEKTVFVYLIDELENIDENQQKLINTLYREKELPVTFRIGARLYGIRTYHTLSANEENKEGSEYEKIELDQFFRLNENEYDNFVRDVCFKRLTQSGVNISSSSELDSFFEQFDLRAFLLRISKKKYSKVHIDKLAKKIKSTKKYDAESINEIISNLASSEDLLIERVNYYLFYKDWSDKKELIKASLDIKEECRAFISSPDKTSRHAKTLSYYKYDLIDQLSRQTREKIPYVGFKTFVKMSSGITRNLLNILKHTYRWAYFSETKNPFIEGIISIESQIKGVYETTDWFFEDHRIPASEGKTANLTIARIGTMLQSFRYSDLPPECSISSFTLPYEKLSASAVKILDVLEKYSFIMVTDSRRDKNTNEQHKTYKLNGIVAPKYELSINRRGVVGFNEKELTAIFECENDQDFENAFIERLSKYNAPFSTSNSLTLFE